MRGVASHAPGNGSGLHSPVFGRLETALREGQTSSVNAAARAGTGAAKGWANTGAAACQSPSVRSKAVGAEALRRSEAVSQCWKAGEPDRSCKLMM